MFVIVLFGTGKKSYGLSLWLRLVGTMAEYYDDIVMHGEGRFVIAFTVKSYAALLKRGVLRGCLSTEGLKKLSVQCHGY